jgi:hypothetical protein
MAHMTMALKSAILKVKQTCSFINVIQSIGQCQQGMERSGQKCAGTGEEYEAYCCCS